MSLHYNNDNSYLFVNGKEIYKFEASYENNFSSKFCLGSISNKFKLNVYDFPVDYSAIDTSNILNIYKYLMIKNKI